MAKECPSLTNIQVLLLSNRFLTLSEITHVHTRIMHFPSSFAAGRIHMINSGPIKCECKYLVVALLETCLKEANSTRRSLFHFPSWDNLGGRCVGYTFKNYLRLELLGLPLVRPLCFHYWGHRFSSLVRTKISQPVRHSPLPPPKKYNPSLKKKKELSCSIN